VHVLVQAAASTKVTIIIKPTAAGVKVGNVTLFRAGGKDWVRSKDDTERFLAEGAELSKITQVLLLLCFAKSWLPQPSTWQRHLINPC
jgi:hypothetical protein